jgi:hypothetical protein
MNIVGILIEIVLLMLIPYILQAGKSYKAMYSTPNKVILLGYILTDLSGLIISIFLVTSINLHNWIACILLVVICFIHANIRPKIIKANKEESYRIQNFLTQSTEDAYVLGKTVTNAINKSIEPEEE